METTLNEKLKECISNWACDFDEAAAFIDELREDYLNIFLRFQDCEECGGTPSGEDTLKKMECLKNVRDMFKAMAE